MVQSFSVSVCVSEACFSCYQLPALSCRARAFRSQGFNTLPPLSMLSLSLLTASPRLRHVEGFMDMFKTNNIKVKMWHYFRDGFAIKSTPIWLLIGLFFFFFLLLKKKKKLPEWVVPVQRCRWQSGIFHTEKTGLFPLQDSCLFLFGVIIFWQLFFLY